VSTLVDVERSGSSGSWDATCRACPWERRDLVSEVLAVELAVEHERECPALAGEPAPPLGVILIELELDELDDS
jgi:hypothetical protein